MGRTILFSSLAVVVLWACTTVGAPSRAKDEPGAQLAPTASAAGAPPVDQTLTALSLGNIPKEAAEVLELCVGDRPDLVGGMAQVDHARDVPKYAWFWGEPPELATDDPAWVVQIAGDLPGRNGTYHDPTCVVINGERFVFVTGGMTTIDGHDEPRSPDARPPVLALPPLSP
jgi:hypothetical protein